MVEIHTLLTKFSLTYRTYNILPFEERHDPFTVLTRTEPKIRVVVDKVDFLYFFVSFFHSLWQVLVKLYILVEYMFTALFRTVNFSTCVDLCCDMGGYAIETELMLALKDMIELRRVVRTITHLTQFFVDPKLVKLLFEFLPFIS